MIVRDHKKRVNKEVFRMEKVWMVNISHYSNYGNGKELVNDCQRVFTTEENAKNG